MRMIIANVQIVQSEQVQYRITSRFMNICMNIIKQQVCTMTPGLANYSACFELVSAIYTGPMHHHGMRSDLTSTFS